MKNALQIANEEYLNAIEARKAGGKWKPEKLERVAGPEFSDLHLPWEAPEELITRARESGFVLKFVMETA